MHRLLLLLLCCAIPVSAQDLDVLHGCPPEGTATTAKKAEMYRFKARYDQPHPDSVLDIAITDILAPGNDVDRFRQGAPVRIRGWVDTVFMAGAEDCNCSMSGDTMRDTRIYLAADSTASSKTQMMLVEVTPRMKEWMRRHGTDWSTQALRAAYQKRTVDVTGWLFFDTAHKGNAVNTKPTSRSLWRATAWEVHPVTSIVVLE